MQVKPMNGEDRPEPGKISNAAELDTLPRQLDAGMQASASAGGRPFTPDYDIHQLEQVRSRRMSGALLG
jgi:hypothetical protein